MIVGFWVDGPCSIADFSRSMNASFTGSMFTNDSEGSAAPSAENTPRGSVDHRHAAHAEGMDIVV